MIVLDTDGRRSARLALALSSLALLALFATSTGRVAHGSVKLKNVFCNPNGKSCASCTVNGTVYGCDTPIPAGWSVGLCGGSTGTCSYYGNGPGTPYSCGTLFKCGTQNSYGPCNSYILCQ